MKSMVRESKARNSTVSTAAMQACEIVLLPFYTFSSSPSSAIYKQTESNQQIEHPSDNMVDCNVKSGMEVYSSEIVSDDCLADDRLGIENEILVPKVGMKFDSEKELFEFYKKYAYEIGFPIRKRNSKKGDDMVVRYVSFTCSREGRRKTNRSTSLNPPPTIEIGCRARLTACSNARGIWRINVVQLEHNHKTSPSKSRLYRCNRELSAHVKRWLEVNDIAGIPLHKSYNSTVVEAGGFENMTCVEKDCRNFIDKVRRLRLGEGDAAALQSYFSKMQAYSPSFYFSIDLDEESRLRNVFWVDNGYRQAYKEFGDVVTFDTTYLTNKYDMSFVPFVGVNHHGQSTLFGCGLVSNEDTNTFLAFFVTCALGIFL
ncbi:protein FAR1-RELATED SEQUENCE 5-like [Olea europaea var. sylvestris]|uniref:protein FAR1-RELATED SEQUENCE 5-like n=1 Tax=Olea europaea var. sylvestris TaxID=158386 RepID=UPI000C1D6351|nr:protein FAR1-RELATED SEQUENCE 5-like [Olea europaea var. sylvestris]